MIQGPEVGLSKTDRTTALYRIIVLSLILLNAVMNYIDQGDECVDENQTQEAELQVSLAINGASVVRVAYYQRPDGGWDVVSGVQESIFASHYAALLRDAASQLESTGSWEQVDELRARSIDPNERGALPF